MVRDNGRFNLQVFFGGEMDGRWMGRLSSGCDELGKTWNVYNVKYVKSVGLMQEYYPQNPLAKHII